MMTTTPTTALINIPPRPTSAPMKLDESLSEALVVNKEVPKKVEVKT
jgi:hypothetical protein